MTENIKLIVLGAGGHSKVLVDSLLKLGQSVWGCTSADSSPKGKDVLGVPIQGVDEIIDKFGVSEVRLVNAVGSASVKNNTRVKIFSDWKKKGYSFISVVHPTAIIANDVTLAEGVQVMAGAIIQPGTRIAENTIINTRVSVDHDCTIGAHVHIAPGVTLSGGVTIGDGSFIGIGASIIQGIKIGKNSMVAAGAVVIRDVPDGTTVKGIPATT